MNPLKKIAIVTGAGSGIGKATAIALSEDGWTVVLCGRRLSKLEQVASECMLGHSLPIVTDVTDPESVKALFMQVELEFARVDLLFNNAGVISPAKPLEDITVNEWEDVIKTNLTGAFFCIQGAFRIMKKQNPSGGRIINNGSISAHVPRPQSSPYTASKHAITGLTRSTSLDGRPFQIACGQVDIGNASTKMTKVIETGTIQADGSTAAEPTMDVNDVARAVVYMASLPLEANVPFMTVMANGMSYMGRG